MPATKWSCTYPVTIYICAKGGMYDSQIASVIGVSTVTFVDWKKKKKSVRDALKRARSGKGKNGTVTFREYVYNRLSPKLQKVWDKLNRFEKMKNGTARMEELLANHGKFARQHLFLYAYCTHGFNASEACRRVNVSISTLEQWMKFDSDFHELFDEMEIHKKNYLEGALFDLIQVRDTSAVIFANKTYNSDRGYGAKLDLKVSGGIEHVHQHKIDLTELEPYLNLETRKAIREAMRSYTQEQTKVETLRIAQNGNGNGNGHTH